MAVGTKKAPPDVTVDDQKVDTAGLEPSSIMILEKVDGKWAAIKVADWVARIRRKPEKAAHLQGPIDDAFLNWFAVVKPTGQGWHQTTDNYTAAAVKQFGAVWDRYFRGSLPGDHAWSNTTQTRSGSLVLFGDPQSNPLIAKVLPKLPITWTKDKLVVNGVEYDPKTHVPVLIYPNPLDQQHLVRRHQQRPHLQGGRPEGDQRAAVSAARRLGRHQADADQGGPGRVRGRRGGVVRRELAVQVPDEVERMSGTF